MTAATVRPRRRRRARAFSVLVATEAKLAWRLPTWLIFGLALPALLLVLFGSIPALSHPKEQYGGISFFNLYAPTLILLVLLVLGLLSLPMQLASYREQGVLRRMWTTPVAPSFLLAAQLALNLALAAAGIGIVLGVGAGVLGLVLPADVGGFVLSVVLSVTAMFALGLCVAAVAGTTQVATGIGLALFYPLAFFAGVYVPLTVIGSSLVNQISEALPSGAAFDALHASFLGHFPGGEALGVLAGYTVVFATAAVRWFRWDVEQPRKRHDGAASMFTRAVTAPAAFVSQALTRTVSVAGDPSAEEVTRALRGGVPSRYEVLPGRKMKRSLLRNEPAGPDYIVVKGGLTGFWRAEVHIVHGTGGTSLQVKPGGDPVYSRIGVARKVRRALQRALS
jgi:ABC-2 type transport system permease protein